jgi:hypothetical protein
MCDVLLPPGVNPISVKYIYIYIYHISYIISYQLGGYVYSLVDLPPRKTRAPTEQEAGWTSEMVRQFSEEKEPY